MDEIILFFKFNGLPFFLESFMVRLHHYSCWRLNANLLL
ncbi:hypothetical protein L458_01222 [Klebsiella pneumoniae BIDMC 22]|nr:hypothetical protein L458_01222 [Klebsiella pneumoniae BIDMC 22]